MVWTGKGVCLTGESSRVGFGFSIELNERICD